MKPRGQNPDNLIKSDHVRREGAYGLWVYDPEATEAERLQVVWGNLLEWLHSTVESGGTSDTAGECIGLVRKITAEAVAVEREACAKIADTRAFGEPEDETHPLSLVGEVAKSIAEAIRARGKPA